MDSNYVPRYNQVFPLEGSDTRVARPSSPQKHTPLLKSPVKSKFKLVFPSHPPPKSPSKKQSSKTHIQEPVRVSKSVQRSPPRSQPLVLPKSPSKQKSSSKQKIASPPRSPLRFSDPSKNRKNLLKSVFERETYANNIVHFLKDVEDTTDQSIDQNCKLTEYIMKDKVLGSGTYATVYLGITNEKEPSLLAIKASKILKGLIHIPPEKWWTSDPWQEIYLLEKIKELILNTNRGQGLPILYKVFKSEEGCFINGKCKSCIISLLELGDGILGDWFNLDATLNSEEHYNNALFQIMAATAAMQDSNVQLQHDDIKEKNILFYNVNAGGYWHYVIGGIDYYVPNLGFVFIISDFGVAKGYSKNIPYLVKFAKIRNVLARGTRGFIRDHENGISYPVLFPENIEVPLKLRPNDYLKIHENEIFKNDTIKPKIINNGWRLRFLDYNSLGMTISPITISIQLDENQKKLLNGYTLFDDALLERADLYPPLEYIFDTQDVIRTFIGGKRMNDSGAHNGSRNAPKKWLEKLTTFATGHYQFENYISLYNHKIYAQDFIHAFFKDIYTKPLNDTLLEKYSCTL